MLKIGYLGPKGTFSQEAVEKYMANTKYEACDYTSIPEIFIALKSGTLDEAVVPIENSLEGAVSATLDMLSGDDDLRIKGEITIEIKQNLMVKPGTNMKDIKYIVSHPQAIGQCRKYLVGNFSGVEIKPVDSTTLAAREIAMGSGDGAAIASEMAARVYNLDVIERGVQDVDYNFTRFLVIAKMYGKKTGNDKTSIVFSTEDSPGSLYRILDIFNLWDINMTKIESRPAKRQLGEYIFFVDIQGHIEDDDVSDALTMVKRKTSYYKFLGSYPRHS